MSWYCDIEDGPEFYSWSEPVARKAHRCCECKAPINKGEKYFSATGKWEGAISTVRQHLLCMDACMFIRDQIEGGECIGFGGLKEYFSDYSPHPLKKKEEPTNTLRNFMARIFRRERFGRTPPPDKGERK